MTDVKLRSQPPLFFADVATDNLLHRSFERLSRDDYACSPVIAESVVSDWPGDVAGRLLLSLGRLLRAGFDLEERVAELLDGVLTAISSVGYFGKRLEDVVDEQQVACHGWVVSGLLQCFEVGGDKRALKTAERIVDELLVPALARLDRYPRTREPDEAGLASGTSIRLVDGWLLSSDTWCVFLALNGLVPAYVVTGRSDIRDAIESLLDLLDSIDMVEGQAQLHATLAAARNAAQYAEITGDARALALAERIYENYANHGRTLNFATFNWFGHAESWTEPCAMVDSIGLAFSLWRQTGSQNYLDDASLIEHNGLGFAERADGSFGLDSIATTDHPVIRSIHPDARWCCTMRGVIGLLEARENTVLRDRSDPDVLHLTSFRAGTIVLPTDRGVWTIAVTSDYPYGGDVSYTVRTAPAGTAPCLTLRPHFPAWTAVEEGRAHTVELPPVVGEEIVIPFPVVDRVLVISDSAELRFRGPLLLTVNTPSRRAPDGSPSNLNVALRDLRGTPEEDEVWLAFPRVTTRST